MSTLFQEFKRRNVIRVAVAYAVMSWLVLQVADMAVPALHLPEWVNSLIFLLLVLGFVPVLVFAWAFELTPEGIKLQKEVDRDQSITRETGKKLNHITLAALALVVVFVVGERFLFPPASAPVEQTLASDEVSIAVLPFYCISSDQTMEFVSDGLAEDITTLLARIPGFFVICRDSAFAYKNQRIDARQVASDLGVRYVVTGSVREMGEKARVTAELIDGNTGNRLWGDRFDSSKETIFELQDEITRTIASHIEPELTRAEIYRIERRLPENLDVWELYHQAHGLFSLKGSNAKTYKESISLLRRAIALDPEFAIAHAYLSLLLAFSDLMRLNIGEENLIEQSMESLEKALQLDTHDSIVLGYTGCALCDMGQHQRGLDLLEQAVENDPSNAQAWVAYGGGLLLAGRVSDSVEKLKYGIRISPLDGRLAFWGTILALALFQVGKPDEAAEEARRACRRDDKLPWPRILLAIIFASQGLRDAAVDAMADARRIYPRLRAEKIQPMIGSHGVKILQEAGLLD